MDPGMLSVEDWQARLLALRLMWLCLILAFTAAGSLVIAHAVIPSAVDSGTLSKKFNKFRLPLYLTGIFAFVLDVAVFFMLFHWLKELFLIFIQVFGSR